MFETMYNDSIKRTIKRILIDYYKTLKLYEYYGFRGKCKTDRRRLVFMIDGRTHHGGLSDRLCGLISAYKLAELNNREFKINYNYPYKLETFLEPNEYDWRINESEIGYNLFSSSPLYLSMFSHVHSKLIKYVNWKIAGKPKDLHLYSNVRYFEIEEFGRLFNTLFKPSAQLQEAIESIQKKVGTDYISITFRFQQLLGDFKETGFAVLSNEEEKQNILDDCYTCIEQLYKVTKQNILVTSDSGTFLSLVKDRYDYVRTIPGQVVHMDFVDKADNIQTAVHMKSFVDFFMLANANHIYLANIRPLYASSFPMVASWLCQKPFSAVSLSNRELKIEGLDRPFNHGDLLELYK